MLYRELPFLRICVPLCLGIIAGLFPHRTEGLIFPVAALSLSLLLLSLVHNKREQNSIYGLALSAVLFLAGNLLFTTSRKEISVLGPDRARFGCTLSDYPSEKPNSFLLKLKLEYTVRGMENVPLKGSILLYHRKDPELKKLKPGDRLLIEMLPLEISPRGNPCEFDYKFYLANQGIRYFARSEDKCILKTVSPAGRSLLEKALITRERIISMYEERGIKGERLALVAAITLGQKDMLEPGQKDSFIKAGVMHIMAVSGLHTVILSLFILNILFFLKRKYNFARILITLAVIWAFAFVTGLTPSVLRATLMFTFLQAGSLMKRPVNGINSVLASAFVLIIINPPVIFDAGFLLSYSAVIYIIVFYEDLRRMLTITNRFTDKIWQSAALTLVAQAGTLPLTLTLFNRFPTYFILTNVVIVPLSSLLVVIGCIIPVLYPLRFLSVPAASMLSFLTGLTETLTKAAAELPAASLEDLGLTTVRCVILTAVIFLSSAYFLKKRPFSPLIPLFFISVFFISGLIQDLINRTGNELIVYNTPGYTTVGIRTGRSLHLFSDTAALQEVKRHCAVMNLKLYLHSPVVTARLILADGKKILLVHTLNNKICSHPLPDYIILTGKRPEIRLLPGDTLPAGTELIAADGMPVVTSRGKAGREILRHIYQVRRSGAFVRRI